MADLYLTIDDSPSANFLRLCAYLKDKNIPAVFFARGDLLSLYKDETVQAIQNGFIIANHAWSHHRASRLGVPLAIKEILKTQKLIDDLHMRAGVKTNRFIRFPYMDSGLGGWPLPVDSFNESEQKDVEEVYLNFYGNDMKRPDEKDIERHREIETTLKTEGFQQIAFENIQVDWYNRYAQSTAVSTQGTFCHPDWYRYKRYEGVFPEETRSMETLNKNFDQFVAKHPGAHIIVMHDKAGIWDDTMAMIDHMIARGHNFLPIPV